MPDPEQQAMLINRALEARKWAYAPYSGYSVGAAVLAVSGKIYSGSNVENAAYPDSICAERVAVFSAVHQGERHFQAIAVATENGGTPCGSCRQVLAEFGLEIEILVVDREGRITSRASLNELLPEAFTPKDLKR